MEQLFLPGVPFQIEDHEDGTYNIAFVPDVAGTEYSKWVRNVLVKIKLNYN